VVSTPSQPGAGSSRSGGPEDLIIPARRGKCRIASYSGRMFDLDLQRLGLRDRIQCESRSTFRSLALACGAVQQDLDLLTHQSPRKARDLYSRINPVSG